MGTLSKSRKTSKENEKKSVSFRELHNFQTNNTIVAWHKVGNVANENQKITITNESVAGAVTKDGRIVKNLQDNFKNGEADN